MCLIMDHSNDLQDVLRCHLCETPAPQCYCEICRNGVCKTCVVEHFVDTTKKHRVVPFEQRKLINYPECQRHCQKQCKNHCEQCGVPICSRCVSTKEHEGHNIINVFENVSRIKDITIANDLEEITNICEKYKYIASTIEDQKAKLSKNSQTLTTLLNEKGKEWHKEIDNIILEFIYDIGKIESEQLTLLEKHEKEIKDSISEIEKSINYMEKLRESGDVCSVYAYKSTNNYFQKLPRIMKIRFPTFSSRKIYREQLHKRFGSVSTCSIREEEYKIPLLKDAHTIITIQTNFSSLYSVACPSDQKLWTRGDKIRMIQYDLNGKEIKKIDTRSGKEPPRDIAITKNSELVYTDRSDRTVNIVIENSIKDVLRFNEWKPTNICSTSSGDLLCILQCDKDNQTKVVRYSNFKEKQSIQFDNQGQSLYSSGRSFKYITENRNLDICVADNDARAIVVVNQYGTPRFRYTGSESFIPHGIATDSQSRILSSDCYNNCIHIIGKNGELLGTIKNCDLHLPLGICIDHMDDLFVAERNSCKVKKIRYCM